MDSADPRTNSATAQELRSQPFSARAQRHARGQHCASPRHHDLQHCNKSPPLPTRYIPPPPVGLINTGIGAHPTRAYNTGSKRQRILFNRISRPTRQRVAFQLPHARQRVLIDYASRYLHPNYTTAHTPTPFITRPAPRTATGPLGYTLAATLATTLHRNRRHRRAHTTTRPTPAYPHPGTPLRRHRRVDITARPTPRTHTYKTGAARTCTHRHGPRRHTHQHFTTANTYARPTPTHRPKATPAHAEQAHYTHTHNNQPRSLPAHAARDTPTPNQPHHNRPTLRRVHQHKPLRPPLTIGPRRTRDALTPTSQSATHTHTSAHAAHTHSRTGLCTPTSPTTTCTTRTHAGNVAHTNNTYITTRQRVNHTPHQNAPARTITHHGDTPKRASASITHPAGHTEAHPREHTMHTKRASA